MPEQLFKVYDEEDGDVYKVHESVRNDHIFHFKVLMLQNYEDTGKIPQCTLHFHFFHKLFANNKDFHLKQLEWTFDKNAKQRLYLSQDTFSMLEVINERLGVLYNRERSMEAGQLALWDYKTKIPNFPYLALTVSSFPTMLSPNFEHMFDYNYEDKCLRVVQTETQKVLLEVPRDVISLND